MNHAGEKLTGKKGFLLRDLESRARRLYVPFRMRREVEIVNKLGLHARPAAEFVQCVLKFKSKITICKEEESFSAASILEVLSANLDCGARIVIEAAGPDEQEALDGLEALLLGFRDEEGGPNESASTS
jgi:phosphocarrier protein HPr